MNKNIIKKILPLLQGEKKRFVLALCAALTNSLLSLIGPLAIGYAIEHFIKTGDYRHVLLTAAGLIVIYGMAFGANYFQIRTMGSVAQRMLWRLRNELFNKLQGLPLAFFNRHKSGDLISRINSDTEKINMFFSQALGRFIANFFMVLGSGMFLFYINWQLALVALIPAVGIVIFSKLVGGWARTTNFKSLKASGALSGEAQEAMANFRVILAFNRRDYFKSRFGEVNDANFKAAVSAGLSSGAFTPFYDFAANIAQLVVLGYGIQFIAGGQLAVGFLVSFILYVNRFYDPLREVAQLFTSLQTALAGWDRISEVLQSKETLAIMPSGEGVKNAPIIEFKKVSFVYEGGAEVIKDVSFAFEKGKTYALVGPTGGGKTTTASLIARLYDPTSGTVLLNGRDLRSYESAERSKKIGFILQEPFLFTGTLRDNIFYGSPDAERGIEAVPESLLPLLSRFDKGLDTPVGPKGALSLGERQLVAFIRAVLRKPEILILDEATANVDTVTEQMLQKVLDALPSETVRVVIAHRLNTIANADEILFVGGGTITRAGSMEHAVDMLLHHKRKS
jgi:ATP-binding cassette subfamily B protein